MQRKAEDLERKTRHNDDLESQKQKELESIAKLEKDCLEKEKRIECVKAEMEEKKLAKTEDIKRYKTNNKLNKREVENQKAILKPIETDISGKSEQAQLLYANNTEKQILKI